MKTLRPSTLRLWLLGLVMASASSGCDLEPDGLDSDELTFRSTRTEVPTPDDPDGATWINNGLEDPDISGVDPSHPLSSPEGLATDGELLADPSRHDLVRYLVECALPEGHGITKMVDGQVLEFEGLIGLAPQWEDGACDEDCQQWVSACLLARTNISGETVTLWLQADHPALGMDPHPLFPVYEASFFGNLFDETDDSYLCQGSPVGSTVAFLDGRTCTSELGESCGFTKYTDCEIAPRCTFEGLLPTAIGCTPEAGTPRHTISTYVSAPVIEPLDPLL